MDWYYADGNKQVGPLSPAEFKRHVAKGAIGPKTLVWNPEMTDWRPYAEVAPGDSPPPPSPPPPPPPARKPPAAAPEPLAAGEPAAAKDATAGRGPDPGPRLFCGECGCPFPTSEMVNYQHAWICAECEPAFIRRIKNPTGLPGRVEFGGFLIRLAAKFIDTVILMVALSIVYLILAAWVGAISEATIDPLEILGICAAYFVMALIPLTYNAWFVGGFAATPGKMICGLVVVTADGQRLTYLHAFARACAEMLSQLTCCVLYLGYLIAAFDEVEKRTLHDHIASTRVIFKQDGFPSENNDRH